MRHGFYRGLGRSHMPQSNWGPVPQLLCLCPRAREGQLLSPCAAVTEACEPRAWTLQQRSHHNEKTGHHTKEWPLLPEMREKPAQQWKPNSQNIKIIKNVITHFVKRRRHSFLWINSSSLITWTLNLIQLQSESRSAVSDSLQPHGLYSPWNSLGQNTGVDGLSLLQGILPTQWSNTGLPHCRRILYQLSHQGSPRILEWVAHPFSSGSSWPRNRTGVSCIAGESP